MIFETRVYANILIQSLKIAPNLEKIDEIKWQLFTAQTS